MPILVGISALSLASIAAYVSVSGLSKIFAVSASVFLFGALEASKLVTASMLHNHWSKLNRALKVYLTIAVIFLIAITSAGLYSFLSSAYSKTATQIEVAQKENDLDDLKKENLEEKIVSYRGLVESKVKRIDILSEQRNQQETRLDSLYSRRAYNSARRTEGLIKDANDDISILTSAVDSLSFLVSSTQVEINDLEVGKIVRESEQSEGDVLTFVYISKLTGVPIGTVINGLIIMLVFIFDPLSVLLLVSFNFLLKERREFDEFQEEMLEKEVEIVRVGVDNTLVNTEYTVENYLEDTVKKHEEVKKLLPLEKENNKKEDMKDPAKEEVEIYHANENGNFNPLDFLSPEERERVIREMKNKQNQLDQEERERLEAELKKQLEEEERLQEIEEEERQKALLETVLRKKEEALVQMQKEEIEELKRKAEKEASDIALEKENFKKSEIERKENEEKQIFSNLDKNRSLYLKMLDVLYYKGIAVKGSGFASYESLKNSMVSAGLEFEDQEYDDFLIVCALLRIIQAQSTNGDKISRKLLKDYDKAVSILSAL